MMLWGAQATFQFSKRMPQAPSPYGNGCPMAMRLLMAKMHVPAPYGLPLKPCSSTELNAAYLLLTYESPAPADCSPCLLPA